MKERKLRLTLEELYAKYGEDGELSFGRYSGKNRKLMYVFYRKGNDYLLVTSEGEEYPLKLETLDKVRDVCCGNMRGFDDYELRVLEKFSQPGMLEHFTKESMLRFAEKETGHKLDEPNLLLINSLFQIFVSPDHGMLSEDTEKKDAVALKELSKEIKENSGMDIKFKSSHDIFTQLMIKSSSDISFERREFLRRIHLKKRDKKG
jgi:hypothetical protein